MSTSCDRLRELLAGPPGPLAALPAEARRHAAECPACAAWLASQERLRRALGVLPRCATPAELAERVARELSPQGRAERLAGRLRALPSWSAPGDLEGRAVAAVQPGFRQVRAAGFLGRGLPPQSAPAELDARLARELGEDPAHPGGAPPELRERLRRDLADLPAAVARRLASRLPGASAPPDLRGRVAGELAQRAPRRRRALALGTLGLLAAGVLFATLRAGRDVGVPAARGLQRVEFQGVDFAVYCDPSGSLPASRLAVARADGVTGGLAAVAADGRALAGGLVPMPPGAGSSGAGPASSSADRGRGAGPQAPAGGDVPLDLDSSLPLLERVPLAPFDVPFLGQRLVELHDPEGGEQLVLREQVASDGRGRFGVELLEVVSAPPGSSAEAAYFPARYRDLAGFIQRHRDFRLRDLDAFHASYRVLVIEDELELVGRKCVLLEVRRATDAEYTYLVWLDPATGLVLSYEERRTADGALLRAVEFEALELDADLAGIALSGGPSQWVEFDPDDPEAAPELGFQLRRPAYTPRGFRLQAAATRTDQLGDTWVEFRYGDGVEQIFFLHSGQGTPTAAPPAGSVPAGELRVSSFGGWHVADGEIDGTPVVVLGKGDLEELLLLVQSALAR